MDTDNKFLRPLGKIPKSIIWTFLVIIIAVYCYLFYVNFVQPYSYRWKALYGEAKYPEGGIRGIDISHYQQHVDWDKISNYKIQGQQISFVFVKATEGKQDVDEKFTTNFENARKHKIIRGAYHFFSTLSSGYEQARHFCKTVKLKKGDLPPVLDIEVDMEMADNEQETLEQIINWLTIVENHYRIKPIIYASYRFKTKYLDNPVFDKYPYWIAHYYVDTLKYDGDWAFWQHTDAGHVDGINGYVDIDMFNGDFKKLQLSCISEH